MRKLAAILSAVLLASAAPVQASSAAPNGGPFTIEYYYKVRWGYLEEWLELYERYHFPVIASEMKDGYVVDYRIEQPRGYWPEPYRWDVRVSITWRDALVAHGLVDKKRDETVARLFPDKARHKKQEQRRFELLEGLWEVEPEPIKLKAVEAAKGQ